MAKEAGPVWFITGCSSGFGQEIAQYALSQGARVVATARKQDAVSHLERDFPGRAIAVALDVTNKDQCAAAVAEAEAKFGRVDVLVNNAGYGYYAAIEEGDDADVRALFDTHVFGLVTLTKLVLPGMRKRRSGTIVNFSSIGGITSFPGTGYYCAAKHAIEGISEALSKEVTPLGIGVVIVEPGPFHTRFIGTSRKVSKIEIEDYAATAGPYRHGSPDRKLPGDPVRAAKAIYGAVQQSNPPLRLLLGAHAHKVATERYTALLQNAEAMRDIAVGADFPAGEPRP